MARLIAVLNLTLQACVAHVFATRLGNGRKTRSESRKKVKFTTKGGFGSRDGEGVVELMKSTTRGRFFGVREDGKKTLTYVRERQLKEI